MYISFNWLKNYIPALEIANIEELSHKISGALAEVEQIIEKGKGLENIVVGEILAVENHPTSKKLKIAQVNIGTSKIQIVFFGENEDFVKKGTFYPVCLPKGKVYNKEVYSDTSSEEFFTVEIKEIEGVRSEGMLCSPKELGVSNEHKGVSILGDDMRPGDNLLPYLKDYILEIENKSLTHRPDCFSHRGIAREISAILNLDFIDKQIASTPIKSGNKPYKIIVRENNLCRRFTSISIENIKVKPSPSWMQILLSYIGVRPINNIVDISNFLMFDIGYPIHMYDYDKIEDHTLIVRKAEKNENFNALNEQKYKLTPDMVVVSDKNMVEDLAGIMGGAESEISDKTKNIIIESASWNMFNIRKTSMTLGINTEASVRFAKGLDSFGTFETIQRAAQMVEEISGGETASEIIDITNEENGTRMLEFNVREIKRLLGLDLEKDYVTQILNSLNIKLAEELSGNDLDTPLKLQIPYYRKDITTEVDIIEEIARIYGYSQFKAEFPIRSIQSSVQNSDMVFTKKIRTLLAESGLDEILTYTFISKELYKKSNLDPDKLNKLMNPLSPELAYLRSEILPSLIDKIESNSKYFDSFGYFEISNVIKNKKTKEGIPEQPKKVSGIYITQIDSYNKLKQKIDFLFSRLSIDVKYMELEKSSENEIVNLFHPTKTAQILVAGNLLGFIGEIHPIVQNYFGVNNKSISMFDLNYDILKNSFGLNKSNYIGISNIPTSKRDLSIWLNEKTRVGDLINSLENENFSNLLSISFVDLYINNQGKKSLTLRFEIGTKTQTLAEKEINESIESIKNHIKEKLNLTLRS